MILTLIGCKHVVKNILHRAVMSKCCAFTFFSGLWDDVGSTLAHDPGHIERAVGLAGDGDGAKHRLGLQLQKSQDIVVDMEMMGFFFPH